MLAVASGILLIIAILPHISGHYDRSKIAKEYPNFGTEWVWFPDGDGNPKKTWIKESRAADGALLLNSEIKKVAHYDDYVVFSLYTKNNSIKKQIVSMEDDNLMRTYFDLKRAVKIFVHGYLARGESKMVIEIKNAYFKTHHVNVIVVDWGALASGSYPVVTGELKPIGEYLGNLITYLCKNGVNSKRIHVIGFSLGAHIAGFAGRTAARAGHTIGRITGLDPAGPNFETENANKILTISDAHFVDVIHTCSGYLGLNKSIGHADFYPNGGEAVQPGCHLTSEFLEACSQTRSWELFVESINTKTPFAARKCKRWSDYENSRLRRKRCSVWTVRMGEAIARYAKGNYYLFTSDKPPYSELQSGVHLKQPKHKLIGGRSASSITLPSLHLVFVSLIIVKIKSVVN